MVISSAIIGNSVLGPRRKEFTDAINTIDHCEGQLRKQRYAGPRAILLLSRHFPYLFYRTRGELGPSSCGKGEDFRIPVSCLAV